MPEQENTHALLLTAAPAPGSEIVFLFCQRPARLN